MSLRCRTTAVPWQAQTERAVHLQEATQGLRQIGDEGPGIQLHFPIIKGQPQAVLATPRLLMPQDLLSLPRRLLPRVRRQDYRELKLSIKFHPDLEHLLARLRHRWAMRRSDRCSIPHRQIGVCQTPLSGGVILLGTCPCIKI